MIAVWALVALCLVAALRTALVAGRYLQLFKANTSTEENASPLVRVVLCLRGDDPFLRDCLARLLNQAYPRYELTIVVDSLNDPAWPVVKEAIAGAPIPVAVKTLRDRSKHRSLLMSAMLEAVDNLPDDCEAIAVVDADVITTANWLRALVAPLTDPQVGVSTGVRWCIPESSEWGTNIRYLWNSFAEPQRHAHKIPWGGSLAIRRDIVDEARSGRHWQRSFCEDQTVAAIVLERGLQVRFVSEAVSAVRETIGFSQCLSFLARQMTWVRLYHPRWSAILVDSSLLTAAASFGPAVAIALLLTGATREASVAAAVSIAFGIVLCCVHFWVEHYVFRRIRAHGGSTHSPLAAWIKCFIAAPVVPILYCGCAIYAHFRRSVSWRGIRYTYQGPWDIQLQGDTPFERSNDAKTASMV